MSLKKLILSSLLIFSVAWLVTGCGQGEQAEQTADTPASEEKPAVERTSEATLSAVVEAVDYDARTFTLKDEAGNTQTLKVRNPAVPLEKLRTGDQVTMTIYEKQASYVAPPGEEIPSDEGLRTVGAMKGEEDRNITVVNVQQMTGTVEAVDVENRLVTLVDAEGVPLTLQVKEDVKNLDKLEVGDNVVTQITQVISVSLNE